MFQIITIINRSNHAQIQKNQEDNCREMEVQRPAVLVIMNLKNSILELDHGLVLIVVNCTIEM